MTDVLRVGNASGFLGDRLSAWREMLDGGPLDVLTGDYLSELTMLILAKAQAKDPAAGWASTFLVQMQDVLQDARARGVRLVANAGGLQPHALAARLRDLGPATVAVVDGDDLRARLEVLEASGEDLAHLDTGAPLVSLGRPVVAANAYLGGWGIAEALAAGADVVVTGRVADAALVSGPAAWRFGWRRDDWDALAGAVVAGHVLECGTQATGGNYAFFREVPRLEHPGFPVAELHGDGSFVVRKHPGHGGDVSVGTVTAQLLYEIAGARYAHPDVVARFDTVRVEPAGRHRVRVWGVRGEPAPDRAKVSLCAHGGYRNAMTLVLTGLDLDEKAALFEASLRARLEGRVARLELRRDGAATGPDALQLLTVVAMDDDARRVGRAFTSAVVELALASYPGLFATAPPETESAFGVFWPSTIAAAHVVERVTMADRTWDVGPPPRAPLGSEEPAPPPSPPPAPGPLRGAPLGRVFGARSGDKGGTANVGVWARSDPAWAWLRAELTAERLPALLPECRGLPVRRHDFPLLRAVNFVVPGLLGDGAAASTRLDAQAKSLGERLRAQVVNLPAALVEDGVDG